MILQSLPTLLMAQDRISSIMKNTEIKVNLPSVMPVVKAPSLFSFQQTCSYNVGLCLGFPEARIRECIIALVQLVVFI
jgi:hypothetical protein